MSKSEEKTRKVCNHSNNIYLLSIADSCSGEFFVNLARLNESREWIKICLYKIRIIIFKFRGGHLEC